MDLLQLSSACITTKYSKCGIVASWCLLLLMAGFIHTTAAADGKNNGKFDFNLEDYIYFPYTYQSLEIDPSINASGASNRSNDTTNNIPKQDNFNNNYQLGWNHVFNKNTREYQVTSTCNGSIRFSWYADNYTQQFFYNPPNSYTTYDSYSEFNVNIDGDHVFNWYTTPETFLSASLTHSLSVYNPFKYLSEDLHTYSYNADSVEKSYSGQIRRSLVTTYQPNLNLCIGRGRISDVTFPAVAVEVLDRLSQLNALDKEIDKTDIEQIAQLFEKLKNTRMFDSRLKRIADMKELCSFLSANSWCKQLSPETVMELLDYWEYAFTQMRSAGHTIAFGFTTGGTISYTSDKNTQYSASRLQPLNDPFEYQRNAYTSLSPYYDTSYSFVELTDYKYGLIASFEKRKPIKLNGQINSALSVSGGMMVNHGMADLHRSLFGEVDGNIGYFWFPNVRSTVRNVLSLDYSKSYWNSRALNWDYHKEDVDLLRLSYYPSIQYYLNPRLEYAIYGGVSFNYQNDVNNKIHDHAFFYSLGCSMNYKIF